LLDAVVHGFQAEIVGLDGGAQYSMIKGFRGSCFPADRVSPFNEGRSRSRGVCDPVSAELFLETLDEFNSWRQRLSMDLLGLERSSWRLILSSFAA
jgi:hypothetical protein